MTGNPYRLAHDLEDSLWSKVRLAAMFDCCKWDIQSEDHCVLCQFPLVLRRAAWEELAAISEKLAAETVAAENELLQRLELHRLLSVPSPVRSLLRGAERFRPSAARVMRFDFHLTTDGWRISEVNSDVPGGYNEASGFTRLMAAHYPECEASPDVAQAYAEAIWNSAGKRSVAFVHATAYMDDRQVMQYLAQRIAQLGGRAVLLGPTHLDWRTAETNGTVGPDGIRIGVVVRFFPADWLPRIAHRDHWTPYFVGHGTPVSNPGMAVLSQSKRFPLSWGSLTTTMNTWRQYLPETKSPAELRNGTDEEWVLKPAFGRVGEDVAIDGVTPADLVRGIRAEAKRDPEHWIAQRRFSAVPVRKDEQDYFVTLGVYTIDGRAAGVYGRIATKALVDHEALDIAVLIEDGD